MQSRVYICEKLMPIQINMVPQIPSTATIAGCAPVVASSMEWLQAAWSVECKYLLITWTVAIGTLDCNLWIMHTHGTSANVLVIIQ